MIDEAMVHQQCINCGVHWMMPKYINDQRHKDKANFYCPNGHAQCYSESEADRLRRERDRLAQQIAQRDDAIKGLRSMRDHQERRANTFKGHFNRIKNRVGNGVCPCCTRSFTDLRRHMATKHPDYRAEAAE